MDVVGTCSPEACYKLSSFFGHDCPPHAKRSEDGVHDRGLHARDVNQAEQYQMRRTEKREFVVLTPS